MIEETKFKGNAGDHLANERTFLAWIRTSIGIMAFGFVVVKFSLFLKQISLILGKGTVDQSKGYSSVAGIVLVIVGVIMLVFSYIKYKKTEEQLDAGYYKHSSLLITILTVCVFIVSVFLIIYLIRSI
jgi:putative membrane protein